MKLEQNFLRSNDLGLLLLRITVGGMMLFHGIHKAVYGVGPIGDMLSAIGLPSFIAYGSLLAELVASLMIVCGVWTRMASVVFAGNMIVAILMAHSADIFSINAMTGGCTGAGKYAVTKGSFLD